MNCKIATIFCSRVLNGQVYLGSLLYLCVRKLRRLQAPLGPKKDSDSNAFETRPPAIHLLTSEDRLPHPENRLLRLVRVSSPQLVQHVSLPQQHHLLQLPKSSKGATTSTFSSPEERRRKKYENCYYSFQHRRVISARFQLTSFSSIRFHVGNCLKSSSQGIFPYP